MTSCSVSPWATKSQSTPTSRHVKVFIVCLLSRDKAPVQRMLVLGRHAVQCAVLPVRLRHDLRQAKLWVGSDEITGCFAKHCDWRLPNIDELKTIVDHRTHYPSIDAIFGPTRSDAYWSATTQADDQRFAWGMLFRDGDALPFHKAGHFFVRAVRGGSDHSER
jgi:hypothetical protein